MILYLLKSLVSPITYPDLGIGGYIRLEHLNYRGARIISEKIAEDVFELRK